MADQTQMINQRDASTPSSGSLGAGGGGFTHDLLKLAELQSQLFLAEVREFRQHSILPSLFLVSGLLLGVASFPVALIALALGLAQLAKLSMAFAFLIVFGVGSLGSLTLSCIGWQQARKRMRFFPRSQEEFVSNYRWISSAFHCDRTVGRNSTNTPKEPMR
jgi:hypothetical protein